MGARLFCAALHCAKGSAWLVQGASSASAWESSQVDNVTFEESAITASALVLHLQAPCVRADVSQVRALGVEVLGLEIESLPVIDEREYESRHGLVTG